MKTIAFTFILLTTMTTPFLVFDFNKTCNLTNWQIVNDTVMGGVSNGNIELSTDGLGVFSGKVSTKNNGGFSMLRYRFKTINCGNYSKVILRLKGDFKPYQFRIKANQNDYYSYVTSFKTNGDWQTIIIKLEDLYPAFRGRKLEFSNFKNNTIEELAFLIGNKKEETFKLLIDSIELQ